MKSLLIRHKIIFAILLFVVIVIFGFFLRGTIVPLYVDTFYRGSVKTAYSNAFTDLNRKLSDLGFAITPKPPTCYNGVSDNGNAWFHYFSETVPCMQKAESRPLTVNPAFISQWNEATPKINTYLIANGWVGDGTGAGSDRNLMNLYATFDTIYYHQVAYEKSFGKYNCDLQIQYGNFNGQTGSKDNPKAYIFESCTRNVSFFGGYID